MNIFDIQDGAGKMGWAWRTSCGGPHVEDLVSHSRASSYRSGVEESHENVLTGEAWLNLPFLSGALQGAQQSAIGEKGQWH